MKSYTFTHEEMAVIREALANYKWELRPEKHSSEQRIKNHALCSALHSQFKDDIRLS